MTLRTFAFRLVVLIGVAATTAEAQVFSPPEPFMVLDRCGMRWHPRAPGPLFRPLIEVPFFSDYPQFYSHIAKVRIGSSSEGLAALSRVDRLTDCTGASIAVVSLPATNGTSGGAETRSFYVLRATDSGLRLIGEMTGRDYEADTTSGHLEFILDPAIRHPRATPLRYQVDGNFRINLADLEALDRAGPVQIDLNLAF